jgi:hypothetical protein
MVQPAKYIRRSPWPEKKLYFNFSNDECTPPNNDHLIILYYSGGTNGTSIIIMI